MFAVAVVYLGVSVYIWWGKDEEELGTCGDMKSQL